MATITERVNVMWTNLGDAWHADVNGIDAYVVHERHLNRTESYWWVVQPSSKRCEFKECYDEGDAKTLEEAQRLALLSAKNADNLYPHINYI